MANNFTIARAINDKRLFGAALGDLSSWQVWLTILSAAFALPLTDDQAQTFTAIAGGRLPPAKAVRELWIVAGRRSGKSRMAALVATYLALFAKHKKAPGERPMVLVIAGSVDQADAVFGFIKGFIEQSPALSREVVAFKRREVALRNGVIVGVHANSYRTVRGRTLVACVLDEVAFWRDESTATPDIETYRAVLPSLATVPNSMLIGISTPYRRTGLLHQKWRHYFGQGGDDTLVVQGASKRFNPLLSDTAIAAQREADPEGSTAEWDAEFRSDVGAFLSDADIDRCIDVGRPSELPPRDGTLYRLFVDMAAGGADAHAACICHADGEHKICDVIRHRHGDPQEAVKEFAQLAADYRCRTVVGDNYAKDWVRNAFVAAGREYQRSPLVKSDLYLEGQVWFTRGLASIPDDPVLVRELRLLERRVARSGKDSVGHPPGSHHDDAANALFGSMYLVAKAAATEQFVVPPPGNVVLGEPRRVPNSVFADEGYPGVHRGSPHRPSRDQPWFRYYGPEGY
jgi:hypothetical protein